MFEEAESVIYAIEARVTDLETGGTGEVDLTPLLADIEALKTEVLRLDARLDAIAGAAADPLV